MHVHQGVRIKAPERRYARFAKYDLFYEALTASSAANPVRSSPTESQCRPLPLHLCSSTLCWHALMLN